MLRIKGADLYHWISFSLEVVLGIPFKIMKKENINKKIEKKVEELHWEIQQWKSSFQFMEDEIIFIMHLLDSYIFQPNTRNLFERLQDYKLRLKKVKATKKDIQGQISKHENTLGGILECNDSTDDLTYYQVHDNLKNKVDTSYNEFQKLKSEIFNYAGGILKKRKPNGHQNDKDFLTDS